jgi:hypothetical protein
MAVSMSQQSSTMLKSSEGREAVESRAMTSRRTFLQGLAAAAAMSRLGLSHSVYGQGALKHPATGTIGLQLYSLRHLFEKGDVPGTLAMVRGWGFTDVEAAGTYKLPVSDFAAQVKKAGLRITSTGADFNALA